MNVTVTITLLSLFFLPGNRIANADRRYFDDNVETVSRQLVDNLVKKNFDAVRTNFHSSLKEALTAAMIKDVWTNTINSVGEFQEIITVKSEKSQNYDVVKVRCRFAKDNATVEVTLNEDEKVVGLYIKP